MKTTKGSAIQNPPKTKKNAQNSVLQSHYPDSSTPKKAKKPALSSYTAMIPSNIPYRKCSPIHPRVQIVQTGKASILHASSHHTNSIQFGWTHPIPLSQEYNSTTKAPNRADAQLHELAASRSPTPSFYSRSRLAFAALHTQNE